MQFVPRAEKNVSKTIHFKLGSRTFTLPVTITYVKIKNVNSNLYPKQKATVKVLNYNGVVKYKSYNSKVASVDSNGIVTAKKAGCACIKATLENGVELGCVYNVAKDKKMIKLVKQANKIYTKWTYDQNRRGKKGYYDCSSLVWRVYKENKGIKFGTSSYGTTSTELPWCKSHCKYLGTKKYSKKYNLQMGDIAFDFYKKNGAPYHVETFAGYYFSGFDKKGNPVLWEEWIFADDYASYSKVYRPTAKK